MLHITTPYVTRTIFPGGLLVAKLYAIPVNMALPMLYIIVGLKQGTLSMFVPRIEKDQSFYG